MTVKDLIQILLDNDLNKEIAIQYPHEELESNNYCSYTQTEIFEVLEYEHGVIIGIED